MTILNDEQMLLKEAAANWVGARAPVSAFRTMRDQGAPLGYDPMLWAEMAALGWPGVIIPEVYGGSGLGFVAMGLILKETGRTLTASPLIASALVAASAIILGGSEEQKTKWLPQIADGSLIAALALDEGSRHDPEDVALCARRTPLGFELTGSKTFVAEGMAADLLIVAVRTEDDSSLQLLLVPTNSAGVSRTRLNVIDSRGSAIFRFDEVALPASAQLNGGRALLEAVLDRGRAGLAAEMLGSATQSFEVTLNYLKTRVQFDQLIGSFQALQHRAAQMLTELELARSTVEAALSSIDAQSTSTPALVSVAKATIGEAWHLISNEMIQMHGGIGMTDAHDAGLYLKRARTSEATFGNRAYHRDRYARLKGY